MEATVVYHYIPGLEEARRSDAVFQESLEQLRDKIYVANYRWELTLKKFLSCFCE